MTRAARPSVRLLHTSDLHLEELGDRRCRGLSYVVDHAIEVDAQVMLVAGDFFDSNRVKDNVVEFAVAEFERFGRDVVVVAGNHDCMVDDSVYHRRHIWDRAKRVHVARAAGGETVTLGELGVTVWGKPLMTYGDGEGALVGMPRPKKTSHWQVAVAHGYYQPPESRTWASFPMTDEQIRRSKRDYIALGDSHAFKAVAEGPVTAYYSGAPSSGTHTVAVVDLCGDSGAVEVARHSLRHRYE